MNREDYDSIDDFLKVKGKEQRKRAAARNREVKAIKERELVPKAVSLANTLGILARPVVKMRELDSTGDILLQELHVVLEQLRKYSLTEAFNVARKYKIELNNIEAAEKVAIRRELNKKGASPEEMEEARLRRNEYQKRYKQTVGYKQYQKTLREKKNSNHSKEPYIPHRKERACLKCERDFISEAFNHRVCDRCKNNDAYTSESESYSLGGIDNGSNRG